ncbi:SsrA-binding protein SmpB [Candidatus Peregrinibacteria bacterium]|jgi:SsrA-binding protein|nr:SsrA-binding protein SmpB [Candidatus Peregrinibacteria bacterium]MBT7484490.1 SsrA-binding protein SmpB [Candidatus Peregrinibacteria bacterium]
MEPIKNKKAFFDYEIVDKFEAGLVLHGYEVKSIRAKKIQLKGGFVSVKNNEVWLENVQISPYQPANQPQDNGKRKRKLLLNRREIDKIISFSDNPGISIVPLKIFTSHGKIKLQIGIGRGKKKHDKRETIKKREMDRDLQQRFKTR